MLLLHQKVSNIGFYAVYSNSITRNIYFQNLIANIFLNIVIHIQLWPIDIIDAVESKGKGRARSSNSLGRVVSLKFHWLFFVSEKTHSHLQSSWRSLLCLSLSSAWSLLAWHSKRDVYYASVINSLVLVMWMHYCRQTSNINPKWNFSIPCKGKATERHENLSIFIHLFVHPQNPYMCLHTKSV